LQTTLQTLEEMHFASPYLVVMNKSEDISDFSAFPYQSIPISAKKGLGFERLQREIFHYFANEYLICELFIPYEKTNAYTKIKQHVIERNIKFSDDGQTVFATVPVRYSNELSRFYKKIKKQ